MSDMICGRYPLSDIRDRYAALEQVHEAHLRFQRDAIRDSSTSCDSNLEGVRVAHSKDIEAFVDYMRESFNRFENHVLSECYGTDSQPTDGEPYWRIRAYYDVYWTSSEPDGGTFLERDTNMEGEWFFRTEIDALEWGKYLRAKDCTLAVDPPRFIPNQEDYV